MPNPSDHFAGSRQATLLWWCMGAVLVALAIFSVRGPVNGWSHSTDFVVIYSPARAWLAGGDPYDQQFIDQMWMDAGGPNELRPAVREECGLIYPPTTNVMFAPIAALPWHVAKPAWIGANLLFLAIVILTIARLAEFRLADQKRWWVFVACVLLFMPVHTVFRVGQTSLYSMALLGLGFCAIESAASSTNRAMLKMAVGGILLGCAALVKPQIGLPFVALEVLRRHWTTIAAALGAIAVVSGVAIAQLTIHNVPWWSHWKANLADFTGSSVGDPSAANPVRHQLLNLQYPLHTLFDNKQLVTALTVLIVGGLALVFFRRWIVRFFSSPETSTDRNGDSQRYSSRKGAAVLQPASMLLPLSMVATLTLMIVYHRYYDAVLLLFPLAWVIKALARRRGDMLAWAIVVLMAPIVLNLATALFTLERKAALPSAVLDQWWWNSLIMPAQAWSLPLLAIVLILAAEREQSARQFAGD